MKTKEKVLIVGSGLCGSLLALRLGQLGYQVQVKESRSDPRKAESKAGRSINLALSNRGLKALKLVGIEKKAAQLCIPMKGRLLHDKNGKTKLSNYSGRKNEFINSISRELLTKLLLDEADALDNVCINFDEKCTGVDLKSNTATFKNSKTKLVTQCTEAIIFGTDGVGSVVRKTFESIPGFQFQLKQDFLSHSYKELTIYPNPDGSSKTLKNALHIWPRKDYMLIALPNLDNSFTVTLFLSNDTGKYNFKRLKNESDVLSFFKDEFPDALALMPNVTSEFFKNPTGILGTIKCSPWQYDGKALLLGDAAHAIVPFYGQGMNASFEDVLVLDKYLIKNNGNWKNTFIDFQKNRKIDTDAIADLAIDNFHEMKKHVANPLFQRKRNLEMRLESKFPNEYFSKYSLVTFKDNVGYDYAMTRGRKQDKIIMELIEKEQIDEQEDLNLVLTQIKKKIN